jgi:hypothetical protein
MAEDLTRRPHLPVGDHRTIPQTCRRLRGTLAHHVIEWEMGSLLAHMRKGSATSLCGGGEAKHEREAWPRVRSTLDD